mmetsp:Transcript_2218/g.4966  ORF Transcript_2218/g.4966 Transcript_2218/m.4966 type:complete len:339 (+) Transcript_2218:257-1273(+)
MEAGTVPTVPGAAEALGRFALVGLLAENVASGALEPLIPRIGASNHPLPPPAAVQPPLAGYGLPEGLPVHQRSVDQLVVPGAALLPVRGADLQRLGRRFAWIDRSVVDALVRHLDASQGQGPGRGQGACQGHGPGRQRHRRGRCRSIPQGQRGARRDRDGRRLHGQDPRGRLHGFADQGRGRLVALALQVERMQLPGGDGDVDVVLELDAIPPPPRAGHLVRQRSVCDREGVDEAGRVAEVGRLDVWTPDEPHAFSAVEEPPVSVLQLPDWLSVGLLRIRENVPARTAPLTIGRGHVEQRRHGGEGAVEIGKNVDVRLCWRGDTRSCRMFGRLAPRLR